MAKNPVHRLLSRFVDVRPDETTTSVLMFSYFFLITSSVYIIKPIKISSFLDVLSFKYLPFAYLLTALLIGFFASLNTRLLGSMKRNVYISFSLIFFIVCMVLFWLLFTSGRLWLPPRYWQWVPMLYWFWAEMFILTSVTQFWIMINDIYTPRQAKRMVGFLVSGGLLGGVVGGLLSSRLIAARIVTTESLLLIPPLMLGACLVLINIAARLSGKEKNAEFVRQGDVKPKAGYLESFQIIRKNRHLLLLSGIMVMTIIVSTLIDFQFNSAVKAHFASFENPKNAMTSFLGTFFAGLLVFSYLFHVLSTNRILKNFGIQVALLITPVCLMLGAAAFFVFPGILMGVLTKGADKSLAHSLSQSVRELLYIPISPEIKYKAKLFIDMFVNKFAKGLGAILILLYLLVFHPAIFRIDFVEIKNIRGIGLIIIAAAVVWGLLNTMITREYVNIVKRSLRIRWQEADKLIEEKIDIDMTRLVFDTLESKNRSSVLYAMNLFDLVKKEKMSPELKKIIGYKSDQIMASSMDSLLDLDGEVLMPEVDDTLDEETLGTQVKEIMSLDVYQELMKEHLDRVISGAGKEAEVSRMEAAKVMGMMTPSPSLIQNLNKLLRDKSPEVVNYAVESAGKLKKREFVPYILQHLSHPGVKRSAHEALVSYGEKIIGTLKDYLGDPEQDIKLRRAIPGILAESGSERAADLLALELKKEDQEIEPEIIASMYRLRSKSPRIQFPAKIILPLILLKIREAYLILMEIHNLMADKKKDFLARDLEKNLSRSLKYIFELLSLIYPREDVIKAYQNICAGTKSSIDYSIELLDNMVRRNVMEALLPLIEDIPLEDKVRRGKRLLKTLERIKLS